MSITSTVVQRADIRFHEAPEALRRFVGCFWVVTADRDATIRIVPDGTTSIPILLQNNERPRWFLRGPMVRPEERRFTSPALLIGVRLRPGVILLVAFIPVHIGLWDKFPVWYHLTFLLARSFDLFGREDHVERKRRWSCDDCRSRNSAFDAACGNRGTTER